MKDLGGAVLALGAADAVLHHLPAAAALHLGM